MQNQSPLNDLFSELKLLLLEFLDARSLHAMLLVNRPFHELIHGERAQTGLWLPLLSRYYYHKEPDDTMQLFSDWRRDDKDWKSLFIEAIKIPAFNPHDHHLNFELSGAYTASLKEGSSYTAARAFRPVPQNASYYFEGNPNVVLFPDKRISLIILSDSCRS